jgi:hypothetical protein
MAVVAVFPGDVHTCAAALIYLDRFWIGDAGHLRSIADCGTVLDLRGLAWRPA